MARPDDVDTPADSDDEPIFMAISRDDPAMAEAFRAAASTIAVFRDHVIREGDHLCWAKLSFRDPDLSAELGEDQLIYLWLRDVSFDRERQLFLGTFFQVPQELTKWHKPGEELLFEADDIFDWLVNDNGLLHGGYTLRVIRDKLPEAERHEFDKQAGVTAWAPLPR